MPPDLGALADRTESIAISYHPADRKRLFDATQGGSVEFGTFRVTGTLRATEFERRFEVAITERSRWLARWSCTEQAGVLLDLNRTAFRTISCRDDATRWSFYIDFGEGAHLNAFAPPEVCLMPAPPAISLPTGSKGYDVQAVRVHGCTLLHDGNNGRTRGPLAAGLVLNEDRVIFMIPAHEPERSLLISSFLMMLASASLEGLTERPMPFGGPSERVTNSLRSSHIEAAGRPQHPP